MAATASAPGGGGGVSSFGRGRGRGRGLRAASQPQQLRPGPSAPAASTPLKTDNTKPLVIETPTHCAEVTTIMNKLSGLSEEEVMTKVVPVIEGLDNQNVIEELVQALSEKALTDVHFACIAAKISQKLWDNESVHQFVRNPLLSRTQALYNRRKELEAEDKYHGLCVYVSELFKILRIRGKALRPMGLPVVELLMGLLKGKSGKPSEEDVKYFYREICGIGCVLMECLQPWDGDAQKIKDQMEELINCARQLVISSSLAPEVRCRLVQVIEMHAGKWQADEQQLNTLYEQLLKDIDTTAS